MRSLINLGEIAWASVRYWRLPIVRRFGGGWVVATVTGLYHMGKV